MKGSAMTTRTIPALLFTILSIAICNQATPSAQPKGERVTVTGEVVEMWCYLEAGDRGAAKKACATACAKAGNPIALVDDTGQLFVLAGLKSHQPAQELLLGKMSERVTVTGTLVKNPNAQMIYIDTVK
jgi:hypothetical protein